MLLKCPVTSLLNEIMMIFLKFTTIINGVVSASWLSYLFTLKVFLSYTYTHVESKLVYWELLYAVILLQYAWMLVNWISIMNGDIVVIGFWPDVQTINLDQFYSSNSSSIIFFIFLDEVGFCFILVLMTKRGLYGSMYNSSPSLSPSTMECQHGRYLNSVVLRQKVAGIPRMVYSNRIISSKISFVSVLVTQ